MSPLLKNVEKAGIRGIRSKRNPSLISANDFYDQAQLLRKEFSKLINSNDPGRIVIIPSVSYGIATVAKNLRLGLGDNIIIAAEQFPSNYYSWKNLCDTNHANLKAIPPTESFNNRGKTWNERILEGIDNKTKAVALGHVHWTDGTKFDLHAIRRRTTDVGALLIVDGTQSVGALPFDVSTIKPDALICAGYKWLLGPYSIGLAYYGERFDNGIPIEDNWINRLNSLEFSKLVQYENSYELGSQRFEVGERSNFILVPMLLKAVEQLNKWGVENIQDYCKQICKNTILELQQKGFLIEEEAYRGSHLFGIRLPKGLDQDKIKEKLMQKKIFVSYRGDAIRVSPNVYNKVGDLDKLRKALFDGFN